jgi:hypothetical protein
MLLRRLPRSTPPYPSIRAIRSGGGDTRRGRT